MIFVTVHAFVLSSDPWVGFTWYTKWNYILLTLYFGGASYFSLAGKNSSTVDNYAGLPFSGRVLVVFWSISFTMVFLVDSVAWGALYPNAVAHSQGYRMLTFTAINEHAVNCLFVFIEFCCNKIPIEPFHFWYVGIWLGMYATFALVYHSMSGVWRYFFLDNTSDYALLWYCGLFAGHALFYGVVILMHRLKVRLTKPKEEANDDLEGLLSPDQWLRSVSLHSVEI
jgi:hypothetical protein